MKVSVIVPCYNQAAYLAQALQSVLDQSCQDWECLIINDGSSDDTEIVAKQWLEKDKRFKYYFKQNGGLPQARNFGIERAIGTLILPLDADDYISENYIEYCVKEISSGTIKLVYGKIICFGKISKEWKIKPYNYSELLFRNMLYCSAMFRKSDWARVGGYDESLTLGLEDWEFWVNILNKTDMVKKLENITFFYRTKEVSMIKSMTKQDEIDIKAYVFGKHQRKYFEAFLDISKENLQLKQQFTKPMFVFRKLIILLFGKKIK